MMLNTIFHLHPLNLVAKEIATISALRLRESREWHNSVGHSPIIHNSSSLPKKTVYCVLKLNFNKVYEVIIPSREDWKRRPHRIADTINIFTDGSKLNNQVGGGYIQQKWEYTKASDYQIIVVCIKRKSLPYKQRCCTQIK